MIIRSGILPLIVLLFFVIAGLQGCVPETGAGTDSQRTEARAVAWAEQKISEMSDRQKIGQLVVATTFRDTGVSFPYDAYDPPSERLMEHMSRMINDYHAGSVIIFNWTRPESIARFNRQLQHWAVESSAGIPLLIATDMEYGLAQRVPGVATEFPRQMGMGAANDRLAAYEQGRISALEGLATGFNWNYSPVADVNLNAANPVIGVRSFGEDPVMAAELTAEMVRGIQEYGVVATPKHFPGHGDTDFDSHYALSTVSYSMQTLREKHLPPFQAAFDAGADAVMTAHIIIEALDPELPATLSRKVLTDLLRTEMGFDGIIVTDGMGMDAIDNYWGAGEAAVMAFNAGADVILATGSPSQQIETMEALYEGYRSGAISTGRLHESLVRILSTKYRYGLDESFEPADPTLAEGMLGLPEYREIAAEAAARTITLVRNEGVLPFDPEAEQTVLVTGVAWNDDLADRIQAASNYEVVRLQIGERISRTDPGPGDISAAMRLAGEVDKIVLFTWSAGQLSDGQRQLAEALITTGKPLVMVSLGLPYDLMYVHGVPAYVATYSMDVNPDYTPLPVVWDAAIDVLFGAEPQGRLPVSLGQEYAAGHGLRYR